MLGIPVDVAMEISVAAPTVRSALASALAHLEEDIVVTSDPPAPSPSDGRGAEPATTWNQFQHRLQGTGLPRAEVARLYREEQEALPQLGVSHVSGGAGASSSMSAPTPPRLVLEKGYVLIRVPQNLEHLRGHHQCGWPQLLRRLGLSHQQWSARRSEFYTPRFTNHRAMESLWEGQGLRLPVPVDPGGPR